MTPERLSAAERREAILQAAVEEIAVKGYSHATTADIARRAGISQPYVFRFFPTKKELAIAVIDRCVSRIMRDWETAVPRAGESRLQTLGRTYVESLPGHTSELLVKFQGVAASSDPEIAAAMRHHIARLYRYVITQAERDGVEHPHLAAADFMGHGFFINAAVAIGLHTILTPDENAGIFGTPTPPLATDETGERLAS